MKFYGLRLLPFFLTFGIYAQDALVHEDRLLLAEGLLARGMYALAAEEYAALATQDNVTPDILFRLAESYHRLDKSAEADAATARLVEKFPGSIEAFRAQLQRAQKSEPARAIELLTPFRAWRGDVALESALLLALADAFARNAKPNDAIVAYEEILRRFPNGSTANLARLNVGLALLATNNADEQRRGTQYLLATAREKPEPEWAAEALYALAQHEYAKKNYADSVGYFELLATQCPDSPRTKISRLQAAWANFLADDRAAALKLLDAHLVADAKSIDQQSWLYLRANILRLNDDPAARATYEKFLADFPNPDPRFVDVRFEYASLLFTKKEFEALKKFFAQNHDFGAHVETALWMQAETNFYWDNKDQALALYKTFEEKFPNSIYLPDALNRIAMILRKIGDYAAAAQTYTRLAQNHPDSPLAPYAWYYAGEAWYDADDNEQALAVWQQGLAAKPDAPNADEIAWRIAILALSLEQDAVAEAADNFILDRFPQSKYRAYAYLNRAILHHRANNSKDAEDDLRACLALNPDGVFVPQEARRLLGNILHEQQRFQEAADSFQLIVRANTPPLSWEAHLWLINFQLGANQPALAEEAARALLDSNDFTFSLTQEAYYLLARALHAQDKNADAITYLESALEIKINTATAASGALLLGQLQLLANDLPAADTAFQDAIKRATTPELLSVRADAYLGLAQSAEAAGKPDDALRYNLAVALLFEDAERVPVALDRAITLLEKLNRPNDARQQLQELLTRYPDSPQAKQRSPE